MVIVTPAARADLFGGDDIILSQILVQTIQQLTELEQIFSTGQDTLGLLKDINQGVRDGLAVISIINPKFRPGTYGNIRDVSGAFRAIQSRYGSTPNSPDADLQDS